MSVKHKFSAEDVLCMDRRELERQFAHLQSEYFRLLTERSSLMRDINDRMQLHLSEIRHLKQVYEKAQEENQELRDLCCFLDDDRQRSRKQAREWQRFGRYTAEVIRSEVVGYQSKLDTLETSQESLVKENIELKQLCIDLSEDYLVLGPDPRSGSGRDPGDGSSSSSPSPDKFAATIPALNSPQESQRAPVEVSRSHSMNAGVVSAPARFFSSPQLEDRPTVTSPPSRKKHNYTSAITLQLRDSQIADLDNPEGSTSNNRRSAPVDKYMKVLDLYEKLDSADDAPGEGAMDHTEKAVIKEMCNVVWRKLGDAVPGYKTPV